MPPILGYWKIRGLAQPIRLLLNYVGEDFEDKQYEVGPEPEFSRACWFNEKLTLGLDFPSLPYYIDGNLKLSQTNSILRYIGRKHNMCGTTEQEQAHVDTITEQCMELRNGFVRLCYNPAYEDMLPGYLKELPTKLEGFDKFLGDKTWFAGKNLTFPDFHMYEMLDQHLQLKPNCLADCPKLKAFHGRFQELPQIKKYMSSDKFMKAPLNNKMAKFGNE